MVWNKHLLFTESLGTVSDSVQTHLQLLALTQQTVSKATTSSAITRGLAQLSPPPSAPKGPGSWSLCRR